MNNKLDEYSVRVKVLSKATKKITRIVCPECRKRYQKWVNITSPEFGCMYCGAVLSLSDD